MKYIGFCVCLRSYLIWSPVIAFPQTNVNLMFLQWTPGLKKRQFGVQTQCLTFFPTLVEIYCIGFRVGSGCWAVFLNPIFILFEPIWADSFQRDVCFSTAGAPPYCWHCPGPQYKGVIGRNVKVETTIFLGAEWVVVSRKMDLDRRIFYSVRIYLMESC